MKCKNCGKVIPDDSKYCDGCGSATFEVYVLEKAQNIASVVSDNPPVKRKSVFRRWWFWLIIAAVIISVLLGIFFGEDSEGNRISDSFSSESSTTVATQAPSSFEEVVTTENPEVSFKESCSEIDFDTLARNPDKYKGNNYVFIGEVIQVSEGWFGNVQLRINITAKTSSFTDSVSYTDTIYATINIPEGEDKILEGDIIKFWGTCEGDYTYESVLGASITLPEISIEYYELID